MKKINKIGHIMLVFGTLVALIACGPKNIQVKDHKFTADISGLELDTSASPTIVYKRPGAPGLGPTNVLLLIRFRSFTTTTSWMS